MEVVLFFLVLTGVLITYQDLKDRRVTWILFPLIGLLLSIQHCFYSGWKQYLYSTITNVVLVSSILFILYIYTIMIAKKQFINHSFGLGDLFFFYAFSLGFPSFTFILLFSFSIFFSSLMFLVFIKKRAQNTVPLAGLMSLFLVMTFLMSLFPFTPDLYRF